MIYLITDEPGIGLVDRTDKLDYSGRGTTGYSLQINQRGTANIAVRAHIADSWMPDIGWPIYLHDAPSGASAPLNIGELETEAVLTGDGATHAIFSGFALNIVVSADAANASAVRVGGPGVSSSAGTPIAPGSSSIFPAVSAALYDLAKVYYWAATGDKVYVTWLAVPSTSCVFAGTIEDFDMGWEGDYNERYLTINAVSFEQCFDVLVSDPVGFKNASCGDIVRYLLLIAAAGVPVVAGAISDGPIVPSFACGIGTSYPRISDALNQLATIASTGSSPFIWGVDPSTSSLYFGSQNATLAPMTFISALALWESFTYKKSRASYRNRQIEVIAQTAFSPIVIIFNGDGSTTQFTLPNIAGTITSAIIGGAASQASDVGTFTGNPAVNDTITVAGVQYTFQNPFVPPISSGRSGTWTLPNQVLIGPTADQTAQNLCDAINYNAATNGTAYQYVGGPNAQCSCTHTTGALTITVFALSTGSAGNSIAVSKSCSVFSWASGTLNGGTDPTSPVTLNVGTNSDGSVHDLYYDVGLTGIALATAPPIGKQLSVTFYYLGQNAVQAQNNAEIASRAAAEHSSGRYDALVNDTAIADRTAGLVVATTALATWDNLPAQWSVTTDQPGFLPGQQLTASCDNPTGIGAYVNGTWIVQSVSATLIPTFPHFRYRLNVMNDLVPSWIRFWQDVSTKS